MARPAKFTSEEILDAARQACVTHWRDTTVAQVAATAGAPIGSIYHRFPSRHALLGALWARSIRRFHTGLLAAGHVDDPREAVVALARHIPEFCRESPGEAKAMTLYRLSDLLDLVPAEQRAALATINDEVDASLRRITARRYGRLTERRYRLALVGTRQCPYGIVRPMVGGPVPHDFDAICVAAAAGILALGD